MAQARPRLRHFGIAIARGEKLRMARALGNLLAARVVTE